jgi:hypothetical protein
MFLASLEIESRCKLRRDCNLSENRTGKVLFIKDLLAYKKIA